MAVSKKLRRVTSWVAALGVGLRVTSSTAALQSAGAVALTSYLSGSSTSAPMTVAFDDLLVQAP